MTTMHCVICGFLIVEPKLAWHLPRFVRCPHCTGYVTEEEGDVAYPQEYFTETAECPQKKSIFSPLLDFCLWMRFWKIRKIVTDTPFNSPSHSHHPASRTRHPSSGRRGWGEGTSHILDYGCGNGKLVEYLRKKGFDAEGYDPEPSAVSLAQRQGLPVFNAIPARQYALVMLWHCLEHSDTPLQDIVTLKSHIAPNGRLLIAVPNGDSFEARLFGESFFCYDWPYHRVHFTPKALAVLLEKTGFRALSVDHFNPEYTVSSLTQTFLNLFLPKNALYSVVSERRKKYGAFTLLATTAVSSVMLVLFSPVLILFFLFALYMRKTAAFVVVAEKIL